MKKDVNKLPIYLAVANWTSLINVMDMLQNELKMYFAYVVTYSVVITVTKVYHRTRLTHGRLISN